MSATSGFMKATTVPPDNHTAPKAMIIDRCVNHGGDGDLKFDQLVIFYCERCGMTKSDAVVVPNSGYQIIKSIIRGAGEKIDYKTEKKRAAVTINGFTTSAGSAADDYSDTVTVRSN